MLKRRIWELLGQDRASTPAARWLRYALLGLIFLNVAAAVLGSVRALRQQWGAILDAFEAVSVFVFTLEYLARLWSCTLAPSVRSPILGRLRYACDRAPRTAPSPPRRACRPLSSVTVVS